MAEGRLSQFILFPTEHILLLLSRQCISYTKFPNSATFISDRQHPYLIPADEDEELV